jgi:ATP-dependent Lhr-like helicase
MQGSQALANVVAQLEGFEAPARVWESEILAARIRDYDPVWLDQLCQSGRFTWLRLSPATASMTSLKSLPIALLARCSVGCWRRGGEAPTEQALSGDARQLVLVLRTRGALFYDELLAQSGFLPTVLERSLGELVANGCVTADSFAGLRALLVPEQRKQRYKGLGWGLEHAGRWTLIAPPSPSAEGGVDDGGVEHVARVLLNRYGVVFPTVLSRESGTPPWQRLVRCYRRLEARGEIRGGRFVLGQQGEQFALPEAVEPLRAVRRNQDDSEIAISASDPLNLVGIVSAGTKISPMAGRRIVFRRGLPVAVCEPDGRLHSWIDPPSRSH